VALDANEVTKALAALPAQNPTATVTIFRESGTPHEQPHVSCDLKDLGTLNPGQYFLFEMEPGKHTCSASSGDKFEFPVEAGEDIYLKLHRTKMSGKWKLESVDSAAGEDAIANAMPLDISEQAPETKTNQ